MAKLTTTSFRAQLAESRNLFLGCRFLHFGRNDGCCCGTGFSTRSSVEMTQRVGMMVKRNGRLRNPNSDSLTQ